jgi:hypothetical protein
MPKQFMTILLLLFLIALSFHSYSYEAEINGWSVKIADNLRINSVQNGDSVLFKDCHWLMQGIKEGKIIHKGIQDKLTQQAQHKDNLLETKNNKSSSALVWGERISFNRNSIQLTYDFKFKEDIENAWVTMYCKIPESEKTLFGPVSESKSYVNYKTKHGNLTFTYQKNQAYLDRHRPNLKKAFRLLLGKTTGKRGFRKGELYSTTIEISLPNASGNTEQTFQNTLSSQLIIGSTLHKQGAGQVFHAGSSKVFDIPIQGGEKFNEKVRATWTLTNDSNEQTYESSKLIFLPEKNISHEVILPNHPGTHQLRLTISRIHPSGNTESVSKNVATVNIAAPTNINKATKNSALHKRLHQTIPVLNSSITNKIKIGFAKKEKGDSWLYDPGSEVAFNVKLKVKNNFTEKVRATWVLTDYFDKKIYEKSEILLLPKKHIRHKITLPKRFGPYRLTLAISGINQSGIIESVSKDVAVFGVKNPLWGKNTVEDPEKSFLGAIIHNAKKEILELAHDFGIRWKRCEFEVAWTVNSKKPYTYNFRKNAINPTIDSGLQGVGQLAYCPPYAVEATDKEIEKFGNSRFLHNPLTSRPPKMELFEDYVYTAVSTFKDDLKYWELWNEPNASQFFTGTPEQYLAMLKATNRILKTIQPEAKLVAPGGADFVGLDPWGKKLLQLGAAKYSDIWSYHQYAFDPYYDANNLHTKIQSLKKALQDNGGSHLEIWNSEGGSRAHTMYRDAELKDWPIVSARTKRDPLVGFAMPKMLTVEMAEGIKKHFIYFLKGNGRYTGFDYLEFNRAPGYQLYPIAAWKAIIGGSDFTERVTKGGLVNLYLFKRNNTAIAMLWADIAPEEAITLQTKHKSLKCHDALGNDITSNKVWPLSTIPIYLEANNMSTDKLKEIINIDELQSSNLLKSVSFQR